MIQKKLIYYLNIKLESGKHTWFILATKDAIKLELLKKKIADNLPYNVRDYGEILYGRYEERAPQEILDEVNQKYGTDFSD